jgi:transposase
MAYRYGERRQQMLFPPSLEEYVPSEAPVRAYDAFVNALDLAQLGLNVQENQVGCPAYDPQAMLKLLIYGYSYGVRSSRKLERECHYNVAFMWLTGGLKPDHKTIAEFRRQNKKALIQVIRQCARLCIKLDLIEGNTLFVDGTKIRANASIKNSWTAKRCQRHLAKIDQRIRDILSECEATDQQEQQQGSLVKMQEELCNQEALRFKVYQILQELQAESNVSTNTTDPDCKPMHSVQGSHAAYNVQSVVDEKHGLIANSDVVNENNDAHQFAEQIEQAQETLEKKCQAACADAGYACVDELEKIDEQGIHVVVPSQKQALKNKAEKPFDKSRFTYDSENDCYICPEGQVLKYSYTNTVKKAKVYRGGFLCRGCCHFGKCTKQPRGRGIMRSLKIELQEKLAAQYEQPDSQKIYALRKQKAELPFGHIKRNLKMDSFLLRGLEGVKAEASVLSSCFNVARMISLIGVSGLIARFGC